MIYLQCQMFDLSIPLAKIKKQYTNYTATCAYSSTRDTISIWNMGEGQAGYFELEGCFLTFYSWTLEKNNWNIPGMLNPEYGSRIHASINTAHPENLPTSSKQILRIRSC